MNDNNSDVQESARFEYFKYINDVMSVRHGDFEVIASHTCTDKKTGNINEIYENGKKQVLQDARHNSECIQIGGRVMQFIKCSQAGKPTNIIASALSILKDKLARNGATITILMPESLLGVAAYKFVYNMNLGNGQTRFRHAFGDNQDVRRILLHL